jgi:hypothetical protein
MLEASEAKSNGLQLPLADCCLTTTMIYIWSHGINKKSELERKVLEIHFQICCLLLFKLV